MGTEYNHWSPYINIEFQLHCRCNAIQLMFLATLNIRLCVKSVMLMFIIITN